jgi:hypothetical protein
MRVKNTVITLMLAGMSIPFVLVTDVYPFYRFGMFAEPVKRSVQLEQFAIQYRDQHQRLLSLDPASVGLSSLAYLMRNYYYRGEAGKLLQRIHEAYAGRAAVQEWQLLKIDAPLVSPQSADTTIVARFSPPL